jgi:uncharacterized protein (DUF1800 family)
MERKTFITSTAALGAETLLNALRPAQSRAMLAAGGKLPLQSHTGSNGIPKPLQTESNDLSPYTGSWGDTQLHHLLRRSMFGVPESQFIAAKALGSMNAVVAQLLAASDTTKVPLPPKFASWLDNYPATGQNTVDEVNIIDLEAWKILQIENWWFDQIAQENLSLRQRMTLLWTNHFVIGSQTIFIAGYIYTYLMTCMANALGNFKDLAYAISIDPAMLVYLNGNQNFVFNGQSYANENYARELMELFTLGINDPKSPPSQPKPNYTETDIQNSARALTGWQPSIQAPFVGQFNPSLHDSTAKTFLGHTGNFGLQDILNIIFEQGTPQGYTSAYWVCQKLYEEFVYYVPNPSVIDAMATVMLAHNFEIVPVMQALLTSAHFYDANVIGAQLKSPAHFMGSLVREFALTYPAFDPTIPSPISTDVNGYYTFGDPNPTLTIISEILNLQGQELLNPPNVKGWPGGHSWISTGTFDNREIYSYVILNNALVNAANNWDLAFNPDSYALQIANANTLSSAGLSQTLEAESVGFTFGPREGGDLDTLIQGTYPNPKYQYNTLGVSNFAIYLSSLPEFQLF